MPSKDKCQEMRVMRESRSNALSGPLRPRIQEVEKIVLFFVDAGSYYRKNVSIRTPGPLPDTGFFLNTWPGTTIGALEATRFRIEADKAQGKHWESKRDGTDLSISRTQCGVFRGD